jgi:hypothetical protein
MSKAPAANTASEKPSAPETTETVNETPLKKLCAELNMDPKKARRLLRRAWRKEGSDISHTVRERWAGDQEFITKMRAVLAPTKH